MKSFETQMTKWRNECKARASIQPNDNPVGVIVAQEIELDEPEMYNPLPENGADVQTFSRIDLPKF
jgi:hypothetical protein